MWPPKLEANQILLISRQSKRACAIVSHQIVSTFIPHVVIFIINGRIFIQARHARFWHLGSFLIFLTFFQKSLVMKLVDTIELCREFVDYWYPYLTDKISSLVCFQTRLSHWRYDAILHRKGPVTRATSKRLQEDWIRAAEEGPMVFMNLRVDLWVHGPRFGPFIFVHIRLVFNYFLDLYLGLHNVGRVP